MGYKLIMILIFIISVFLFMVGYLRYYEKKNIYFPQKKIYAYPDSINLTFREVFFTTADGVRLNAWFIPGSSSLTLLFFHGNAGNIGDRLGIISLFYELGCSIFIPDYRGYGKSESEPTEEGLYLDAQAAFNYLRQELGISGDSIIIYGKSLGSAPAIDLASRVKAKALVCDSAFSNAKDMARIIFPFFPAGYFLKVKFDSLSKIEKVDCPKLFIHSKEDEIIPFYLGRRLYRRAKQPKFFCILKGSHNEAIFEDRENFVKCFKNFLNFLSEKK